MYHVRPHIFFLITLSIALGFFLGSRLTLRNIIVLITSALLVIYTYNDILSFVGIRDLESIENLDNRAASLMRATSAVNISDYNQVEKIFTFLFRPLFFDAPGFLGFFTSLENLIYLIVITTVIKADFFKIIFKSSFFEKSMLFSFIFVTISLAQVSGNLGIALRQKSQVLFLLFFVIMYYLEKKQKIIYFSRARKIERERQMAFKR